MSKSNLHELEAFVTLLDPWELDFWEPDPWETGLRMRDRWLRLL